MEEIQLHPLIYPSVLVSFFLLWFITKWFSIKPSANKKNIPPSPRKLPILGNLHQLGSLPHRNLQILSRTHGPLMLLHFGSVPALIVSSAAAAREILKTHDIDLADRPPYESNNKLLYDCKDIAVAPYGEYWRQVKSMFVLQVLSNKRVQSFRYIREEETANLIGKINSESTNSGKVNLSKMFSEFAIDGICRSAFGVKCSGSESGKKFLTLLADLMELLGAISIADFVPWLRWIKSVNGFNTRVDKVAKEVDDILESVIREITENPKGGNGENFVEILFEIYNDKTADVAAFDKVSIKALVLDAFIAGTDTVSTVLESLMAELLRHPNVMKKLQKEVREIVGGEKHDIKDEDMEKMHYMKAVIKETLRCHPPLPTLLPKLARKDLKIMGYDVSKGTVVMFNAWAMAMDPECWDEPEKFEPERFLNDSKLEFKSLDFEMLPFGAGRRGCPGISFGLANVEFVLANLVHKFNWELPDGLQGKDLDMSERHGGVIHRAVPLLAVATRN